MIQYININELQEIQNFNFKSKNLFLIDIEVASTIQTIFKTEKDIKRVLEFLRYFNSNMDENNTLNTSILSKNKHNDNINNNSIESFFTRNRYKEFMALLSLYNIVTTIRNDNGRIYTFYAKTNKEDKKPSDYKTETKCYQLTVNLNNDLCIVYFDNQDKTTKKINNKIKDLDKRYIKTIKHIKIDIQKTYNEEYQLYLVNGNKQKFISRINRLFSYSTEEKYIKYGENVNRIYHNLSSVSRIARENTNIKFNSIDIPNCQPLLLAYVLKLNDLPVDDNYYNDCINANFYEQFYNSTFNELKRTKIKGTSNYTSEKIDYIFKMEDDRSAIKVLTYEKIFFRFETYSSINKRFKELYPLTWDSYNTLLNQQKDSSAHILQNTEASIMNNIIPQYSEYYYTLFDAIYFDNIIDKNEIINNISNKFKEIGIILKKLEVNKEKININ